MASNYVAIEFEKNEIRIAACQSQGKQVRIRAAFQIEHSEDDTDEQIGEKLKSAVSKANLTRSDATIVIHRSDVEIREMTVPPVPDNELPSMVRFKSKTEFATATENWTIDYVTLNGNATSERELLATALSGKVADRLTKIAESAGLKVKHIVLRPLATLDLMRTEIGNQLCMVIAPNGESVDLTLVNDGRMILTRSVRSNAHGDLDRLFQQMTMEAQRTLASATKRIGNRSLEQIFICGEEQRYAPLGKALQDRLGSNVNYVNPFAQINLKNEAPNSPERYASLVGTLMSQGLSRKHDIDFLNPRKPIVERNNYQKAIWIVAGLAALLLVGAYLGWAALNSQQKKIKSLKTQLTQLQSANAGRGDEKGVEQVIGEVELVDFWLAATPNWLDELECLSNLSIDSDKVILDKFVGTVGNNSPLLNFKGRLNDRDTASELKRGLASIYKVQPSTTQSADSKDYKASIVQDLGVSINLDGMKEKINRRADLLIDGETTDEEVVEPANNETETE